MSKSTITLHPKDKVDIAKTLFEKHDIHHIVIIVMDRIVGILSMGDIFIQVNRPIKHADKYLLHNSVELLDVEEFMTENPITINENKTMKEGLNLMLQNRINALPVESDSKLVGILTTYDIMKYLKENN